MWKRARVLKGFAVAIAMGTASSVPEAAAEGPAVTITPVLTKPLAADTQREIEVITVEYAPGGADPVHRHHAQGIVYVLEGTVEMQVKGGPLVKLGPGESFYEGPDDLHTVGRNASTTAPAKFLVFLVKNKGAPILVPE